MKTSRTTMLSLTVFLFGIFPDFAFYALAAFNIAMLMALLWDVRPWQGSEVINHPPAASSRFTELVHELSFLEQTATVQPIKTFVHAESENADLIYLLGRLELPSAALLITDIGHSEMTIEQLQETADGRSRWEIWITRGYHSSTDLLVLPRQALVAKPEAFVALIANLASHQPLLLLHETTLALLGQSDDTVIERVGHIDEIGIARNRDRNIEAT
ncbi:MAG: hypothetical protein KF799_15455 [Bdellovibrionales bacterium]|nr:hypothetical protein [Bdellovibrionales bacterium]